MPRLSAASLAFPGTLKGTPKPLPYYPHELDAHADGARIRATLEQSLSVLEADITYAMSKDAEEAEQAAEEEIRGLKSRVEDLEGQVGSAEREQETLHSFIVELATALLNQCPSRLATSLSELGDYMERIGGWSVIYAAELAGHAEALLAPVT